MHVSTLPSLDLLGVVYVVSHSLGLVGGAKLGAIVLTTVTVACIFFELIGQILTKYALTKAGEIDKQ